ncbi:MAG: EAL domain-containing response regulator [Alphaproteobacteria bacterium]|nr:EAL domain-containing response regulator [Alphaproteobacteria bacterium]
MTRMQDQSYAGLRVLIVDHHPQARQWCLGLLGQLGVEEVEIAEDRAAAIEVLNTPGAQPLDLILAELHLPDGDGVDMLRELAEHGSRAAVILVTGVDPRIREAGEDLARARGLRVLGSLAKPLTVSGLGDLLSRHAFERPADTPSRRIAFSPDDLRRAVEGDELLIYFQPKVAVGTGAVSGVEALVRWLHPEYGILQPDTFIPAVADAGFIEPMTYVVLDKAMTQLNAWREDDLSLTISVNIPAECMDNLILPRLVEELIRVHRIPASALILEITESGISHDLANALDVLTRLRLNGVGVSIDDFGTGYATISRLAKLPFDELKLDRTLVTGAHETERLQTILRSTISLAQDLKIRTVAEGVETVTDWRMLETIGCDSAQGFYMAMPMPGDQVAGWMTHWAHHRTRVLSGAPILDV